LQGIRRALEAPDDATFAEVRAEVIARVGAVEKRQRGAHQVAVDPVVVRARVACSAPDDAQLAERIQADLDGGIEGTESAAIRDRGLDLDGVLAELEHPSHAK